MVIVKNKIILLPSNKIKIFSFSLLSEFSIVVHVDSVINTVYWYRINICNNIITLSNIEHFTSRLSWSERQHRYAIHNDTDKTWLPAEESVVIKTGTFMSYKILVCSHWRRMTQGTDVYKRQVCVCVCVCGIFYMANDNCRKFKHNQIIFSRVSEL